MKPEEHSVEVIVVGTGIGGLAMAKTYLELSPETNLLLIEKRTNLGGVWAEENCYEGLTTNNLHGTYEFSDFPMDAKYKVKENEHIPASVVCQYLKDFADHFDLHRRISFNTTVLEVEKLERGWKVFTEVVGSAQTTQPVVYTCDKLVISTGLASNPNPISIPGQEDFGKPMINQARLRDTAGELARDPDVKSVTVMGASKTGYDVVYLMALHGKKVEWIIRESGGGPVWMSGAWLNMGGWQVKLQDLASTRLFSWFSPCIWGDVDGFGWIRRVLHGTFVGRFLVHHFWEKFRMDVIETNGYRKEAALKHLEPPESPFWSARVGILNYPSDIHDFIRSGQVTITKKDIDHLSENGEIHFTDSTTLQTDALIGNTGWKLAPTIKYKPAGLDAQLGIPCSSFSSRDQAFWDNLDHDADKIILHQFPSLRQLPTFKIPFKPPVSPFRLYRGIAPPSLTSKSDFSLAYLKMVHCTENVLLAETQALWIYAYLNGKISNINAADVYRETALASRFGKHRYPCGFSSWYPEFVFDAIPYVDMLLMDLGMNKRRKPTWFRELFEAHTIHDYRGINREWRAQAKDKKE